MSEPLYLHLPVPVWVAIIAAGAAILGSCMTLGGVFLSNWLAARERQRDRELTLKREVFMPAAEAVIGLHRALMELADLDQPEAAISKRMQEFGSKLSVIDLLAAPRTVAVTSDFLFRCITAAALIRVKRSGAKKCITGRKEQVFERLSAEVSSWSSSDDETVRDQRFQKLRTLVDSEGKSISEDIALLFELLRSCVESSKEIGALVPPIIFALRAELGMTVNEGDYVKVWQKTSARTYKYAERVLAELEKMIRNARALQKEKGPHSAARSST